MTISRWLDQSDSHNRHFDAVIVGAGIAGLSTAYWLERQQPGIKIALIEKNRVGFGASGRNAGFVTCGSTEHFIKLQEDFGLDEAVQIWKFSEENHRLLAEHVIQDEGASLDYRKTGSCTVAPSEERWQVYRETAKVMRAQGLDVTEVTPKQMQDDYGVTGFQGGIQYSGDGFIHPIKLLGRLQSQLKAQIFEGTEVYKIANDRGSVRLVTDRGVFSAGQAFLTLNAYLPLVMRSFESWVTPGRGQILMTEPLPDFVKGPCYLTKHLCYFRQLPTGHLLIGGFRNLDREVENTYADQTTDVIQNALFDFVKSHFKHGPQAKIAYQWSGLMGFSTDGQMILGPAKGFENVHVMAGCSGHGMGLSFHAAKTLVEGTANPEKIPPRLRLSRLEKN